MSERGEQIRQMIHQRIEEEISRLRGSDHAGPSAKRAGIPNNVVFFVVTKPQPNSKVTDLVFQADPLSFANQLAGGLKQEEIALFTTDEQKAMRLANSLLGKETLDPPTDSKSKQYKNRLFMREGKK